MNNVFINALWPIGVILGTTPSLRGPGYGMSFVCKVKSHFMINDDLSSCFSGRKFKFQFNMILNRSFGKMNENIIYKISTIIYGLNA